jgi:hypothetical protein
MDILSEFEEVREELLLITVSREVIHGFILLWVVKVESHWCLPSAGNDLRELKQ